MLPPSPSIAPQPPPDEDEEAGRVAAWLTARPGFLADRPALYRRLVPPRRVHGERLADHMAAMLGAERDAARAITEAARSGGGLQLRVQRAVLALIAPAGRHGDPAEVIAAEWPALLGLDSVAVAGSGTPARHLRPLPAGLATQLLPPGREWRLRDATPDGLPEANLLHGEAAPLILRDALLRLPAGRLLVLGTREAAMLPERGAGQALLFLARAAAAALGMP
ncbi:hypothetical protein [Roseomonas elaeocarpi]|uniref:DUF484 domain-containing protein n=1 Tax=Roseomonas elaeocarpi TaxID=907779 RepID=A0ABV6JYQ3_9PROT